MSARDVARFVENLLRGRRTKPFRPDDDDAAQMRAAITLRAGRTGSGAPREEFVTGLQQRLAAELDTDHADRTDPRVVPIRGTRRQVIQFGSVAAAAAAIGVLADQVVVNQTLVADGPPAGKRPAGPDTTQADATLTPTTGTWTAVAAVADVADGAVRPFEVGGVAGFLHRSGGQLSAVSGTCTHQGCRLRLDVPAGRLQCPCHSTAFAVTGELLTYALPVPPRPLPHLMVRVTGDAIEVYAPPPTA
jgi:cytochrome b6-f complex iron-sulfur subunit